MGINIGPLTLDNNVLLAPMSGVSDLPFRRLVKSFGAGLVFSEMIASQAMVRASRRCLKMTIGENDVLPLAVQLAGCEPEVMAEAARLNQDRGAAIIDINMGCPVKKVCNRLAGSALLQDENLVGHILDAVVASVTVPVTLKIRTGWDAQNRNGVRIAKIAENCGVQALAVHGRTRACRFRGAAEYETIAEIKSEVDIPVIANGDITTLQKSCEVLRLSGADAAMIGRGAQGRPWFFRELNHYLETGDVISPLENNKVRDIMLDHLSDLYQFYGDTTGVRVARKHLTWYCAGLKNSDLFRSQVVRVNSASEQVCLTQDFFAQQDESVLLAA